MSGILELSDVCKRYGSKVAADNVTFSVPEGSVFGLLGPNGAGKTTTIRSIMRIILPDSGEILLEGREIGDENRRRIGYLPEERGLYRKMKVLDHLVFLATIRGVPPREARSRAQAWLERFEIGDRALSKVEELSKGMQQKLQIIGTLLHRPRLLILDEPFSGLDPLVTRSLKDLLGAMRDEGVTVVLSTHVLPQVDELCDHICLINDGRVILTGDLPRIREELGGNTWVVDTPVEAHTIEEFDGVRTVTAMGDELLIELEEGVGSAELVGELVGHGGLERFTRFVPDLENIFIRAVEEDRDVA